MDFQQAESRFNALRDQLRDGTISRAEFVRAVGQIMVYDAYGRYWTLDPRTGHWLYFDGQTWQEAPGQTQLPTARAVAPTGAAPPPYVQEEAGGIPSWLLLGIVGLAALALCLLGTIALAIIVGVGAAGGPGPGGQGPTVQVQSPGDGAQLLVNQEIVVQSVATDPQGVTRIELWVDGNLSDVTTSPDPNGQPSLVAAQRWTFRQPGPHTIQVRARNRANAEGTSPLISVHVIGEGVTVTPPTGPDQTPGVSPIPCINDNVFVSDVTVPDGTRIQPGARVDKVWRLRNTGTCEWGAGYRWVYVDGEQMDAPESVAVPATAPGQEVDLRVVFTAPFTPGTYVSRWQMQTPDGARFGIVAVLNIVVRSAPTATPRPTATTKPVASPTPEPLISFYVDKKKIAPGDCTKLHWDVEYVKEVYLKEGDDPEYGVGGHGEKKICPTATTKYVLRVVKRDGQSEYREITVKVE